MSFSNLETLVSQLQELCSKCQTTNIRCSESERPRFPVLAARLVDTAAALSRILHEQTTIKAPNEAAKELATRFSPLSHIPRALKKTMLRRNLSLIFLGPPVSAVDSNQVKARKIALQDRCKTLESLAPGHIILWSTTLPPSNWAAGDMSKATFHYLVQELCAELPSACSEELGAVLGALSSELPFATCDKFLSVMKEFTSTASPKVQSATEDADMTSDSDQPTKKRRRYDPKTQRKMSLGPKTAEVATHSQPAMNRNSGVLVATMANVEKLGRILGNLLYTGMMASRLRREEMDGRIITLTDCFRLHMASRSGEDFKAEIWLSSSTGSDITDAMDDPVRLRNVLGDYIFEAMRASSWRRRMVRMPATFNSVDVSYPHGNHGDCKLEVRLNFEAGHYLYVEAYDS
ncbi:hypothetical protein Purlil1_13698 [Purpureocillium lilacinum]|uniref:Uncharacterized protein n=1 Tax=Purpureocillium lilacinum TaxID=33203 RepID=A0ABR0BDB7_PURLI|nr:hypothetical protein Purlil1_13698 [Purpureocillium lilacinum]